MMWRCSKPWRSASPLRYCGGKAKVAPLLRIYRRNGSREYREVFCGGSSLFFETGFVFERAWLNDRHPGLIAFLTALRDRPDQFIAACRAIAPATDDDPMTAEGPRGGAPKNARLKAEFDAIKLDEDADQALRFFVVNRMVHGSGRVNYAIPNRLFFGSHEGWDLVATNCLEQAAATLQGARITCGDYRQALEESGDDVWCYLDPPYVVNSALNASSQQYEFNFTEQDHVDLAAAVRKCPHAVMLTYDDCELVRDLYPESEFWVDELAWKYSGTTLAVKRLARELVICNYVPPFMD